MALKIRNAKNPHFTAWTLIYFELYAPRGDTIIELITSGKANLASSTPLFRFIMLAVTVVEVLIKRAIALAKLKPSPKKSNIGTNATALPTPPIAKNEETKSVMKKYSIYSTVSSLNLQFYIFGFSTF